MKIFACILAYFAIGALLVVVLADDRVDLHFEEQSKPYHKFLVALFWPLIVIFMLLTP